MHHKYHVPEVIHLVIAVAAVIENYRIYREMKLVISLIKMGGLFSSSEQDLLAMHPIMAWRREVNWK